MDLAIQRRLAALRPALRRVAVTGTSGKTTTVGMIHAIVAASGERAARIDTLGSWIGDQRQPEALSEESFVTTMERALAAGVRTIAIETVSAALMRGHACWLPANIGVFTNLSYNHLSVHGTMEAYLAAKAQLFVHLPAHGAAVLNTGDPASGVIASVTPGDVRQLGYAASPPSPACAAIPVALQAQRIVVTRDGSELLLAASPLADALGRRLSLRVIGEFLAENALAAALAAHAAGYAPEAIRRGLEAFAGIPGRFQVVVPRPTVVVDYAHAPVPLRRVLLAARALAAAEGGRVVCVFGCGGEFDRGKRPMMGEVVATDADLAILTTDNARDEDPENITREVLAGVASSRAIWHQEPDRRAALELARSLADERDVVVIAGRGHEETQDIGGRTLAFSDIEVAREVWAALTSRTEPGS